MNILQQIFNLLQQTIIIAPPILITAVGACISEKSGVVNIGLEGIMLSSAFATAVVNIATGNPYLGIIFGVIVGVLISLIHAVISINLKGNQIISGVAINLFAAAITSYLIKAIYKTAGNTPLAKSLANRPLMIIIIYGVAIVMYFFLYKTVLGLRIRSVGEHPLAAFSNNMSAGRGYIAMAAMIFGKWNPLGAILASLLFAFGQAFADVSKTIGLPISQQFLTMIPYILTLLALVGFVGKSKAPKASGLPYEK